MQFLLQDLLFVIGEEEEAEDEEGGCSKEEELVEEDVRNLLQAVDPLAKEEKNGNPPAEHDCQAEIFLLRVPHAGEGWGGGK